MTDSTFTSLLRVWNKLQEKLCSTASSSSPFVGPKLTQLNDMVYEVYSPLPKEKPHLEIVFVHGLQLRHCGDAYIRTWMSRDDSQLWIQTWLVELFPKARILTIAYDASIKKTHKSGTIDMHCTAENLVHCLTGHEVRVGQVGCPVVLVGHCLGGLLLKELCLSAGWMVGRKSAESLGVDRIHDLLVNLRGMFFYGTPHNGSLLDAGLHGDIKGALLEDMEILKASSARRNQQFDDLKSRYRWYTSGLGELHETYVECLGKYIHVVPEASARSSMDSYYSVAADHHDICKPDGKKSGALMLLRDFLNKIQEDEALQAGVLANPKSSRGYVDLEGRAKQVRSMLARQDTHAISIVGLSGIGKTALAKQVFHGIAHNFTVTCFVSLDSIEESSNCEDQVLRKIHQQLGGVHVIPNHNSVPNYLKPRRVLMVIDNLESQNQLDALCTDIWLEGSASKLIVTSTNARLGTPANIFEVEYLSWKESNQLFRHYAFEGGDGPHDLRHLISRVIDECNGFPLSLKILGGYVSKAGNLQGILLDLVDRLEKAQEVGSGRDDKIWAKLRVCYDVLQPTEKEIFLDIATFFHGFPLSFVKCIWQGSRESPHIAWKNLIDRFLASENVEQGNIWMHTHLRNLGRSIACPRGTSVASWKRISGSSFAKELISNHQAIVDTLTLKLQIAENESLRLEKPTFLNYVHLQYLVLEGVEPSSGRLDLPRSLVYLRWTNGLFVVCPVDFTSLENLVAIELRDCKSMKSLSPTVVSATKLMWLELQGCLSLTKLPLGLSKCLLHLGLNKTGLRKLPGDLRKFRELTHLEVNTTRLTKIPEGLGGLEMLSSLDLRHTGVTALPESIGDLKRLIYLDLSHTMLTSLPDSIGRLQELRSLYLRRCTMLSSLPQTIGELQGLRYLDLTDTALGALPESIGQLQSLLTLNLDGTHVKGLPQSVGGLVKLCILRISRTPLETLPDTICNLRNLLELDLEHTQLSTLPGVLGELEMLRDLYRHDWTAGRPATSLIKPSQIINLVGRIGPLAGQHVLRVRLQKVTGQEEESGLARKGGPSDQDILSFLSPLSSLQAVTNLTLDGRGLPQSWIQPVFHILRQMPSLEYLTLKDFFWNGETIPCELGTLPCLKGLNVVRCIELLELPESLGELQMLEQLRIYDCPSLIRLPESLSALTSLSDLTLSWCRNLESMPRSFGHVSSSEGPKAYVKVDSWRLAKCFLECPWKHFPSSTEYRISCWEMDEVRKKAIEREGKYFLDSKVAMELFEELNYCLGGYDNRPYEISEPSSHSSGHHCAPHSEFRIICEDYYFNCRRHSQGIRVMDLHRESDADIQEVDDIMDSNEESDEESEGDVKEEDSVMDSNEESCSQALVLQRRARQNSQAGAKESWCKARAFQLVGSTVLPCSLVVFVLFLLFIFLF